MIQISDVGNSVFICNKYIYSKNLESRLSNNVKFKVDTIKGILHYTVNHDKHTKEYLKSFKISRTWSVEQHEKIQVASSRPDILHSLGST